jgi:hypothetical protein
LHLGSLRERKTCCLRTGDRAPTEHPGRSSTRLAGLVELRARALCVVASLLCSEQPTRTRPSVGSSLALCNCKTIGLGVYRAIISRPLAQPAERSEAQTLRRALARLETELGLGCALAQRANAHCPPPSQFIDLRAARNRSGSLLAVEQRQFPLTASPLTSTCPARTHSRHEVRREGRKTAPFAGVFQASRVGSKIGYDGR